MGELAPIYSKMMREIHRGGHTKCRGRAHQMGEGVSQVVSKGLPPLPLLQLLKNLMYGGCRRAPPLQEWVAPF
jgi:hypothetical protein